MTLLFSTSSFAQSDIFIIDGKKVENYDGSQLVNRKIVSYKISTEKGKGKIHTITTVDAGKAPKVYSASYSFVNDADNNTKPTVIVNGMEVADIGEVDPKGIYKMTIYKAGSDSAKAYGEIGKNGVVKITKKK